MLIDMQCSSDKNNWHCTKNRAWELILWFGQWWEQFMWCKFKLMSNHNARMPIFAVPVNVFWKKHSKLRSKYSTWLSTKLHLLLAKEISFKRCSKYMLYWDVDFNDSKNMSKIVVVSGQGHNNQSTNSG